MIEVTQNKLKGRAILCLETASKSCSVCLSVDGEVIAERKTSEKFKHSELLGPFVSEVLTEAGLNTVDLSAIAINKGPGSYTGLRVGFALAKAICFSSDIPLIGISGLEGMAWMVLETRNVDHCVSMISARKNEMYISVYDRNLRVITPASVVDISEGLENALGFKITKDTVIATDIPDLKRDFPIPSIIEVQLCESDAKNLVGPAYRQLNLRKWEDLAYFEPLYLKEPRITTPKQTLL